MPDEHVTSKERLFEAADDAIERPDTFGTVRAVLLALKAEIVRLRRFEKMYEEATKVLGDEEVLQYVTSGNAIPVTRCTVSADLIRQLVVARSAHEPEARRCNHGAISPKGTMFFHGFVDGGSNHWRCDVCNGVYEGNLTDPDNHCSQALTLVTSPQPPLAEWHQTTELPPPYEPSPFTSEGQAYIELREELRRTQDECSRLQGLINSPHTADFMQAVQLEAAHQRERWAVEHDAGKTDADWFWLIGYLAGKALNKPEKQLHHIITTAAACLNWHANKTGVSTAMRPGIAATANPEDMIDAEYHAEHPPIPCLQPGLHPDKCVEHGSSPPPRTDQLEREAELFAHAIRVLWDSWKLECHALEPETAPDNPWGIGEAFKTLELLTNGSPSAKGAMSFLRHYIERQQTAIGSINGSLVEHDLMLTAANRRVAELEQSAQPPKVRPAFDVNYQAALVFAVRELLDSLPQSRDWLNPDAERVFREYLSDAKQHMPVSRSPLRDAVEAARGAPPTAPVRFTQPPFQARVQPWMLECFGEEIAADKVERSHRFIEESLELAQARGMPKAEALQLVDYVYGRPAGDPLQEVGGVMVTLAALCLSDGVDMHAAGETELARIWTKIEQIRAKQAGKPKGSPLPEDARAVQPPEAHCEVEQEGEHHDLAPGVVCIACWNRATRPPQVTPWVACSDRMPPIGLDVFAFYRSSLGNGRTVRAEYVAPRSIAADQWCWDDDCPMDVDDEGNEWVPSGWWERALMQDVSYAVDEPITHWTPIPPEPCSTATKGAGQ